MSKLISTFLDDVKRSSYLPCTQKAFSTADLVAFTNEELRNTWADMVLLGEEFFTTSEYWAIKDSVGNRNFPADIVPIPQRAFSRAVRELKVISKSDLANGLEPKRQNIPWITLENEEYFVGGDTNTRFNSNTNTAPYGFYFVSDGIKFTADFRDSDESLEIRYVIAPPVLESSTTLEGEVASLIWSPISDEVNIDVSSVGTDLNTYCTDSGTALFDIYRKSSGALLYANVLMTRSSTTFSTDKLNAADMVQIATFQPGGFSAALNTIPTGYSADIYIVPAGRNSYVPLDVSMTDRLQARVVQRILAAQGDTEMLKVEQQRNERDKKNMERVHNDRMRGENKTIPMVNGFVRALTGNRGWRR